MTEAIASRAPALNGLSPLHDKAKDLGLGRHDGAQARYVYADNLGVIAKTQEEADIVMEQWNNSSALKNGSFPPQIRIVTEGQILGR